MEFLNGVKKFRYSKYRIISEALSKVDSNHHGIVFISNAQGEICDCLRMAILEGDCWPGLLLKPVLEEWKIRVLHGHRQMHPGVPIKKA
jgi:hypothetical protein